MTRAIGTVNIVVQPPAVTALAGAVNNLTAGYTSAAWALMTPAPTGLTTENASGWSFTETTLSGPIVTMLDQGGQMVWDSTTGRALAVGAPAGSGGIPSAVQLIYYDENSNAVGVQRDPVDGVIDASSPHIWNTNSIDVVGRRLYKHKHYFADGSARDGKLCWVSLDAYLTNGYIANDPRCDIDGGNAIHATSRKYYRFRDNYTALDVYDLAAGTWSIVSPGAGVISISNSAFAHYNPNGDVVVMGGGYQSPTHKFGSINAAGQYTDRGAIGRIMSSYTTPGANQHALVVPHPTEAASIAYCQDATIWKCPYTTWTWSQIGTIPTTYRSRKDSPGDYVGNMAACSIPSRGCVLFIEGCDSPGNANSRVFIHRPA